MGYSQKKFYVISYDIVEDRNRVKASDTLKNYGVRVQKSVFECRIAKKTLKKLLFDLKHIIDPETDSILVYILCEACDKQRKSIGIDISHDDEEFRIL